MSKGLMSREYTRREFMKLTGKGLAGVGLSSSMLKLFDCTKDEGIFGNWTINPETCHQCENAPCMLACPVGAITPDPLTGVRLLDQDVCIGCGACVAACPWKMPRIDPSKGKSTKCIACGACVAGCPTSALKIVLWDDVAAAI